MSIPDYTSKDVKRFWSKVDQSGGEDACWTWSAYRNTRGYGMFGLCCRPILAHRFSYAIANGPFDNSLLVCHHCDNPSCVNPKHLFLGTFLDNVRDRDAKGRRMAPRGEKHTSSKISAQQVIEIRERYASGGISLQELANEFSSSKTHMFKIIHNKKRQWG